MAVGMSGVLLCIAVVRPGVIVKELSVGIIGLGGEVCVPVTIVVWIN
jgi:hypothetical protein